MLTSVTSALFCDTHELITWLNAEEISGMDGLIPNHRARQSFIDNSDAVLAVPLSWNSAQMAALIETHSRSESINEHFGDYYLFRNLWRKRLRALPIKPGSVTLCNRLSKVMKAEAAPRQRGPRSKGKSRNEFSVLVQTNPFSFCLYLLWAMLLWLHTPSESLSLLHSPTNFSIKVN